MAIDDGNAWESFFRWKHWNVENAVATIETIRTIHTAILITREKHTNRKRRNIPVVVIYLVQGKPLHSNNGRRRMQNKSTESPSIEFRPARDTREQISISIPNSHQMLGAFCFFFFRLSFCYRPLSPSPRQCCVKKIIKTFRMRFIDHVRSHTRRQTDTGSQFQIVHLS